LSGEIFNLGKELLAIALTGCCIKLMDDFLDREIDQVQGKKTLTQGLGDSVLPYSLLLLMVGMALNQSLAGSLFLATYIIGMGKETREESWRLLPSGIPHYLEMLLGTVLGVCLWGFEEVLSSLAVILTVQFFDDFYDYQFQGERNLRNWVQRIGKGETIILTIIFCLLSLILDWEKLVLVLAVTPLILCFFEKPKLGEEKKKMIAAFLILLGLTTFLIGYTIGRKCGKIQGRQEGTFLTPLQIRQQSLEEGRCRICGYNPEKSRQEEI